MINATLRGKPDAGNPHVRFDEGEVASAQPRRGSLLYYHVKAKGEGEGRIAKAKAVLAMASAAFVGIASTAMAENDPSLKYSITFDDSANPLVADVGDAATVVQYTRTSGVVEEAGLGHCSLVTDETIKAGLAAGSNALTIPTGYALRVAHGINTDISRPWCISMRVYIPAITSGGLYHTYFDLFQNAEGDGTIATKKFGDTNYCIGGGSGENDRSWGWTYGVQWDAWHTLTCSVDVDATRVYLDGALIIYRKSSMDVFHLGRVTLRARPYIFISGDENGDDNTLHFDWVKIYDVARPAELFGNGVAYHTFDGEDALASTTMGHRATIVNYSKNSVTAASGLGDCSIATDPAITAGLEAGSKALSIVKGQALRIEHGIDTSKRHPWGISMRVYVPENTDSGTAYNSLFTTAQKGDDDATLAIKRDAFGAGKYAIGNGRFWNYFAITHNAWHIITVLTDEKKSSLFVDGKLLTTVTDENSLFTRVDLTGRKYIFVSGDESGEDALLHFDWVKIFDNAEPGDLEISKYATWTSGGWVLKNTSDDSDASGNIDVGTEIRLTGETSMNVPKDAPVNCGRVVVEGTVTLADDLDWRGLGFAPWRIKPNAKLDLNGHKLRVSSMRAHGETLPTMANLDSLTEDTVDAEFVLDVDEYAEKNDKFIFSGGVKFVKEGEGDFTAYVEDQHNSGGVEVRGGKFRCGFSPANGALGAEKSDVKVSTNTVFDMCSRAGMERHTLWLDGGKITSSLCWSGFNGNGSKQDWNIGVLKMTADSVLELADLGSNINSDVRVAAPVTWDLGGNTLDILFNGYDSDFYSTINGGNELVVLNGTIRTRGPGWFHDMGIEGSQGCNLDLDNILRLQVQTARKYSEVCDFKIGRQYTTTNVQSYEKLKVNGTFTPDSDYCIQVEMQDGSAIDLSPFNATWSLTFKPTGAHPDGCTTAFAPGANVTIKIGTREFTEATKLVSWSSAPMANFELETEAKAKYRLSQRDDGVYIGPRSGMVVIMK